MEDIFLLYQKELHQAIDDYSVIACEKSRRIGFTWALASKAVLVAGAAQKAGGMNVYYSAYEKEMTREFIETCAMWAKTFNIAAEAIENTIFKDDEGEDIQAFRIRLGGFSIVALSGNPRALRGRQGLFIFDEAAFNKQFSEMLKAALAFLMWGGKVVICSTHDGVGNPFNRLVEDIRAGRLPYHLIRVDLNRALAEGLYKRICEKAKRPWSQEAEDAWRKELVEFYGDGADEELFCIPRNSGAQFLPRTLVEGRMSADIPVIRWRVEDQFVDLSAHRRLEIAEEWCRNNLLSILEKMDPNLRSFFGMDFGRSGDISAMLPLQIMQDLVRKPPFLIELRNMPFDVQRHVLFYVIDRLPRFVKAAFDATGNGAEIAEAARQRYGAGRVEEVKFSLEWYRLNMPPYKAAFEGASILLPKDAFVLEDHESLVMQDGVAQPKRSRGFQAHRQQRHGDTAIAGALAYQASRLEGEEYDYRPLSQGYGQAPRLSSFGGRGTW